MPRLRVPTSGFAGVRAADKLALTMTDGKTSPISAVDVGRAVAAILDDPAPPYRTNLRSDGARNPPI
jgi:uncharacterized protein YbjT (DUF2867 family)